MAPARLFHLGHGRWCRCLLCRFSRRLDSGSLNPCGVQAHLAFLVSRGVGTRRIADLANVNRRTVQRILNGQRDRVHQETARRLLSVTISVADGKLVSSWRVRQLISALRAEGYSEAEIRRCYKGVRRLRWRDHVRLGNQRIIERIYTELTT